MKLTILITMAGLGSRFRKAGYTVPKYQIEAKGKTLFEWSMESLEGYRDPENDYIFVVRKEDETEGFIREKCAQMGLGNVTVIELLAPTDGQATTAMLAKDKWDPESGLMIYNIDTYVEAGQMKSEDLAGDGFLPCFHAPGDHWSFAKLDESGKVTEVREKVRISDNCTLGAYYFKSCALYQKLYETYYSGDEKMEKGEKYVAPLYNFLIENGGDVRISIVDADKVHVLGTPEELNVFLAQ